MGAHKLCFGNAVKINNKDIYLYIITDDSDENPDWVIEILDDKQLYFSLQDGISGINSVLYDIEVGRYDSFVLFTPSYISFSKASISHLIDAVEEDPFYGFSFPIIVEKGQSDEAQRLVSVLPPSERRIPTGAPLLVKGSVLRDFGLLSLEAENLDAALVQLFAKANRRGFSAHRANQALIEVDNSWKEEKFISLNGANDYYKAQTAQCALPEVRFERLMKYRLMEKKMKNIIFDIRNLAPGFNGTAHHILALLEPLRRLAVVRGMCPFFWVLPSSADFHNLYSLYPENIIHEIKPDQCFDASVRLTQPWSLTEVRDQAYISTINVVSVLDTIAWDCHYIRMPHLEGVWRSMAEYTDGFIFNSNYTKERFTKRFDQAAGVDYRVAYCSLDPTEYWAAPERELAKKEVHGSEYVIIVGNRYYHKGLAEVVRPLSSAFPEMHFKVLGEYNGQFYNVEQISSGTLSSAEMAKLFAGSCCLVFPSFYEGFGLPILEALAFNKPVLARRSALIEELKERVENSSRVHSFCSTGELLVGLKNILRGSQSKFNSTEVSLQKNPYRWENSAGDILDLIESLLASFNMERCRKRLEFFYRQEMFDLEREGWKNSAQNAVSFEFEKEE